MKRPFIPLLLTATLLAVSCSKDTTSVDVRSYFSQIIDDLRRNVLTEVYASNGEEQPSTKTVRESDGSIYWQPGDKICLFPYGSSTPGEFTSTSEEDAPVTTFSGEMTIKTVIGASEDADAVNWNYAVYPYDNSDIRTSDILTVTVPSNQTAVSGSFDPAAFLSIGRSDSFTFKFYNLCGGIKFSLKDSDIKSITIKGNNGEKIAGQINVSIDENSLPYVVDYVEGAEEITLSAPSGTTFNAGEWYYFSMLPTSFTQGLTLSFVKDGYLGTRVISAANTVNRSRFIYFNEMDAKATFEEQQQSVQAFFASDRHSNDTIIGQLLAGIKENGASISYAMLCGDMVGEGTAAPEYNSSTVRDEVLEVYPNIPVSILYAAHDENVTDDAEIVYDEPEAIDCGDYFIYTIPESYVKTKSDTNTKAANAFVEWALAQDVSKPIFIASHMPLMFKRGDNRGAEVWCKALNHAATGSSSGTSAIRNIVFFCGHNHYYELYEYSFAPGSTMSIQLYASGSNATIRANPSEYSKDYTIYFASWVAGYLNARGHGTLVTIDNDNIKLERYDADGLAEILQDDDGCDGVNTMTIARFH